MSIGDDGGGKSEIFSEVFYSFRSEGVVMPLPAENFGTEFS